MERIKTSRIAPEEITEKECQYPSFGDGKVFEGKKTDRLPAMGWNSWNAFGSGNTEKLTKVMGDRLVELGLDQLGYKYVVLDDGCYMTERVEGKLSNDPVKFPEGFKALADYLHERGLKFGMYNDIGTNLCAGAAVGTCGYEDVDAESYNEWDIDFLKVDNCYYLWDNATFSNPENARFSYAPKIASIKITKGDFSKEYSAIKDGKVVGNGAVADDTGVSFIGTLDGTNTGTTPLGELSSELEFVVAVPDDGEYLISVLCKPGRENGCGEWLQLAVGLPQNETRYFDGIIMSTESEADALNKLQENSDEKTAEEFKESQPISVMLTKGRNIIRLMNHRRQENVLNAYATMFNALKAKSDKDILLSICEWGKTQPHTWGYKVGDSWRILNDITFSVGSDGNPGTGSWNNPGTQSIASQYNKAVIMDEFSGPDKGYNDPDMMVIGMDGITEDMNKTHMAMWCMMNAPLMLGIDLRRVEKGDSIYKIIANKKLIEINQDSLGVQAKRVYSSIVEKDADKTYITNNNRVDILAKPLANGNLAVSFINLSDEDDDEFHTITLDEIVDKIGDKMIDRERFEVENSFIAEDVWTGYLLNIIGRDLTIQGLKAHENLTYIIE